MPDLPACRDALSQAATTLQALVDAIDQDRHYSRLSAWVPTSPEELRADIQAARAQLDLAEQALTGTEGK